MFLLANIREVEKELGISYPTVCKRLDLVNDFLHGGGSAGLGQGRDGEGRGKERGGSQGETERSLHGGCTPLLSRGRVAGVIRVPGGTRDPSLGEHGGPGRPTARVREGAGLSQTRPPRSRPFSSRPAACASHPRYPNHRPRRAAGTRETGGNLPVVTAT